MRTNIPFTRAQAAAAGISDTVLSGTGYKQLFRGVHVSAQADIDQTTWARAALLVQPEGALLTSRTAAHLIGLPLDPPADVDIWVPDRTLRRPRPGIRVTTSPQGARRWVHRGLPMVDPLTLFLSLHHLPLLELVKAGDALLGRELVTRDLLAARCEGVRRATLLHALACIRPNVDAPTETLLRMLLVLAGFPEPVINHAVGRYRIDLSWPLLRLGLEYDGQHHRADLNQWDHDIVRDEWFRAESWRLLHIISRDLFRRPEQLLARIYRAYVEAGGAPFTMSDAWRPHFAAAGIHLAA